MSQPPIMQIAIDCRDPHLLAHFWAGGFGYEVEDHQNQIEELVAAGYAGDDDIMERDGRLVWKTAAACRHPEGLLPRLLFQQVPESKSVKNRVHPDIHLGEDRREETIVRLEAAGATRLWDGQQGPHTWVTLADPEGNEFCVS